MKLLVLAAAVAAAVPATTANLVVNGDFSAGNSGFTSTYTYAPSSPTAGLPRAFISSTRVLPTSTRRGIRSGITRPAAVST